MNKHKITAIVELICAVIWFVLSAVRCAHNGISGIMILTAIIGIMFLVSSVFQYRKSKEKK